MSLDAVRQLEERIAIERETGVKSPGTMPAGMPAPAQADELLALLNWCADMGYIVGFERLDPSLEWGASLAWGGEPADYADARGATPLDALRVVMRQRGWTPPDA